MTTNLITGNPSTCRRRNKLWTSKNISAQFPLYLSKNTAYSLQNRPLLHSSFHRLYLSPFHNRLLLTITLS
jgi:hypothetical protein